MARENRDLRPFDDLSEMQSWLEEKVTLHVCPNEGAGQIEHLVCPAGSTLRVDPRTLATADIKLHIEMDELITLQRDVATQFAKRLGTKKHDVFSIVLYGTSRFLHFTDEILRWGFEDLAKMHGGFSLLNSDGSRPRSLRLPHHGTVFQLAVILNSELKPQVGLPHRMGTWLARVKFMLSDPAEGIGFTPRHLTDEIRTELKLSKETATFPRINSDGNSLLEAEFLDDFVLFYVDSPTLNRLSLNPLHPQSALYQTQIFIDALKFVVAEFQRLENKNELRLNEVDDKLIGRLLRVVSSDEPAMLQSWLEILRNQPEAFIAEVEHICDYQTRLDESLALMLGGNE
jgi:hypothetical protein